MAFKVWDGFDHYNDASDFLNRSGFLQWQFPNGAPLTFQFVPGLLGSSFGEALEFGWSTFGLQFIRAVWGARNAEAYVSFRVEIPLEQSAIFVLQDTVATAPQIALLFSGSGYWIQAFRGTTSGTLLGISANNAWVPGVPQFIEIHYVIGVSGTIQVRVAGNLVLNLTSTNTQNSANAWSDAFDFEPSNFGGGAGGGTLVLDDLNYMDNTTGPGTFPANTFIGDARVATLFPTGELSVAWTPDPGSNANWQNIKEVAMDGDTTYNYSSTAGQEDDIAFGPLTNTLTIIYGVQLTIAARKDDAGSRVIKQGMKSGSAETYGSNWSLSTSYQYFTDQWILDPNTSANWTVSGVNAAYGAYNLVS